MNYRTVTDGDRDHLDEWPVERTVYLTLDLECDYGTALERNSYEAARHTERLAAILERHDVPVSCFLQTEVLETAPEAVEGLTEADVPVEFHAHSHTHPRTDESDVGFEVRESVERIRDRFGTEPLGYRFPNGEASSAEYATLAATDVAFGANLFPMWYPGRFDNTGESPYPFRHVPTDVVELPFTVYSPRFRVPVALSYLKLLGRPYEELATRRPPSVVVFDFHMHDLFVPESYDDLSRPYRAVYARRKYDGPATFDRFVGRLKRRGYEFGLMSDLYARTAAELREREREVPA